MNVYTIAEVQPTTDQRHNALYGFNIVGVHGRPLVSFSYETRADAEAAQSRYDHGDCDG